jgi:hypothetical protein
MSDDVRELDAIIAYMKDTKVPFERKAIIAFSMQRIGANLVYTINRQPAQSSVTPNMRRSCSRLITRYLRELREAME